MILNARTGIATIGAMTVPATQEAMLQAERAQMVATRRQVRLGLGEAACDAMDAAANDPALPWALRDQIKSSHEWHRTAPEIDEFGWVMGLSATDIDALFRTAATL